MLQLWVVAMKDVRQQLALNDKPQRPPQLTWHIDFNVTLNEMCNVECRKEMQGFNLASNFCKLKKMFVKKM